MTVTQPKNLVHKELLKIYEQDIFSEWAAYQISRSSCTWLSAFQDSDSYLGNGDCEDTDSHASPQILWSSRLGTTAMNLCFKRHPW